MWHQTIADEMKVFILGLQTYMGLYSKNSIYEHWAETFVYVNIFSETHGKKKNVQILVTKCCIFQIMMVEYKDSNDTILKIKCKALMYIL